MRRSRQVNADMAKKLEKEEEERKNAPKRPSRGDFKHRQSVLLSSFAPMKPIVVTREIETQTESEPLKTFTTMDTQTDASPTVETNSVRIQTENADMKERAM